MAGPASGSTRETDRTGRTDRTGKVSAYGRGGVPVCLLPDMEEQAAAVFRRSPQRIYGPRLTTPFGEPLRIPKPFGCAPGTRVQDPAG
ncbi:hypothetical protein ACLIYP_18920 [Streptomyces nanhaiensis]|uniref:hypothetical protein n=1 Tax=Streptomyces nanhaiensis TaxID=679319 RepID=UPI00399C7809